VFAAAAAGQQLLRMVSKPDLLAGLQTAEADNKVTAGSAVTTWPFHRPHVVHQRLAVRCFSSMAAAAMFLILDLFREALLFELL
jgi:hypothetical protein